MNYEWKKVAHDAGPAQSEAKGLPRVKRRVLSFIIENSSFIITYLIHYWLATGVSPEECIQRIMAPRQGQKRNVAYYARYSVQKAMKIRQVQSNRSD